MSSTNFQKQLRQMQKELQNLEKTKEFSFDELFTTAFMRKYTPYTSFDELLQDGGFDIKSQADFEAIPDHDFDMHIAAKTKFNSWQAMLEQATHERLSKMLGI